MTLSITIIKQPSVVGQTLWEACEHYTVQSVMDAWLSVQHDVMFEDVEYVTKKCLRQVETTKPLIELLGLLRGRYDPLVDHDMIFKAAVWHEYVELLRFLVSEPYRDGQHLDHYIERSLVQVAGYAGHHSLTMMVMLEDVVSDENTMFLAMIQAVIGSCNHGEQPHIVSQYNAMIDLMGERRGWTLFELIPDAIQEKEIEINFEDSYFWSRLTAWNDKKSITKAVEENGSVSGLTGRGRKI